MHYEQPTRESQGVAMMTTQQAAPDRSTGIATALAGALSNQLGTASGSQAFPVIGPVGVVAIRLVVAAAILLPTVRPRARELTRAQWWPVLLLAVVFASMNLGLYLAIDRIGLGLAVTLEFCGPLAVALVSTRSRRSAVCALIAGAGVIAIARPQPSTDYLGIGLGVLAACSWAAYILLNRTIGSRIPGIQGTATAVGACAAVCLPVAVWILITSRPDASTLFYAVGAGVLATTVPFVADVVALRRISANLFGILMSANPVLAALIGALVLHEDLGVIEAAGVVLIVTANIAALLLSPRRLPSAA